MRLAVIAVALVLGAVLLARAWPRTDHVTLLVRDASRPATIHSKAIPLPFRSGDVSVDLRGRLDGEARLVVTSDGGGWRQEVRLPAGEISWVLWEVENWSDGIEVSYLPITARQGSLDIDVTCGRRPMMVRTGQTYGRVEVVRPPPGPSPSSAAPPVVPPTPDPGEPPPWMPTDAVPSQEEPGLQVEAGSWRGVVSSTLGASTGHEVAAADVHARLGIGESLAFDRGTVARHFPACSVGEGIGGSEGETWTVHKVTCAGRLAAIVHPNHAGGGRSIQFFAAEPLGGLGPLLGASLAAAADRLTGDEPWTCVPALEERSGLLDCSPRDEPRLVLELAGEGAAFDGDIPPIEILRGWQVKSVAWSVGPPIAARAGPVPFEVQVEPAGEERWLLRVRVDGGVVPLGMNHGPDADTPGSVDDSRVDRATVGVTWLPCPEPLLHVHWQDFVSGTGLYQSAYHVVVPASDPARVLLSGSVPLSGHGGAGTGRTGNYSLSCEDGLLVHWRHEHEVDASPRPRPLARRVEPDPNAEGSFVEPMFVSEIATQARMVYAVEADRLRLRFAELSYRTRSGDALAEVLQRLQVEPGWVENAANVGQDGTWIAIVLPEDEVPRRFPPLTVP